MVSKLALAAIALAAAASPAAAARPINSVTEHALRDTFLAWTREHGRTYVGDEYEHRFGVFMKNHEFIQAENAKGLSYTLAINAFADMTHEEFKAGYLGGTKPENKTEKTPFTHANKVADATVDWRAKGAVTDVKNQGQCGSCWAFSTTGSVEGATFIATGTLPVLSEQELVDCDRDQDMGCSGGLMDNAFAFVIKNGLASEDAYPYTAQDGQCNTQAESQPVAHISSFSDVPVGDEDALAKAVTQQPVSIAIEADQQGFQFYSGGIFDGECGKQLDHGVLAVGYGSGDNNEDYWIVKNSWGATWGENGYIRLVKGQDQCGITQAASYPVV